MGKLQKMRQYSFKEKQTAFLFCKNTIRSAEESVIDMLEKGHIFNFPKTPSICQREYRNTCKTICTTSRSAYNFPRF